MKPENNTTGDLEAETAPHFKGPSAGYIQAISEFLDTDPSDLLVELGYYEREYSDSVISPIVHLSANQE